MEVGRPELLSRFYYHYRSVIKSLRLYLFISITGLIVMIADNDAGWIPTYADPDDQAKRPAPTMISNRFRPVYNGSPPNAWPDMSGFEWYNHTYLDRDS